MHTMWVTFQSPGFYDVPRVLIHVCQVIWHTWPRSHADIDPMPDKMSLDNPKLLYCEFQKYEVMTTSVLGGQSKKHANPSYKATKHIEHTFLISDYYQ